MRYVLQTLFIKGGIAVQMECKTRKVSTTIKISAP